MRRIFLLEQTDKKTLWKSRIQDYRSSNEQVADWCNRHGVTSGQLWYWIKKLKKESAEHLENTHPKPNWVSLHVKPSVPQDRTALVVVIGAARLEVPQGVDQKLLADVVTVVRRLC